MCRIRAATATLVLLSPLAAAQTPPDPTWIRQFGLSRDDSGRAATPDGAGGVFVAGSFTPPTTFYTVARVTRFNSAGAQLWDSGAGPSLFNTFGSAIALDGAGGVYMAGATSGHVGGVNAGSFDAYLARYTGSGSSMWARQLGSSGYDSVYAAAPDASGGVYIVGSTDGPLLGASAGGDDVFVARYSSDGVRLWGIQFGTPAQDLPAAALPDGAGGVFIAGATSGNLAAPNLGGQDFFLARLTEDGVILWTRQFGTSAPDTSAGLVSDGGGGVVLAGTTRGNLAAPNAGLDDVILARFDADGDLLWSRQHGGAPSEVAWAAATDGAGGVYIAGHARPGLSDNFFVALFDAGGNQVWWRHYANNGHDRAYGAAPDQTGGVYVVGVTTGGLGGPITSPYTDGFIARFPATSCYANCDASTASPILNVADFSCFLQRFAAADPWANCDGSTSPPTLNAADFGCFLTKFALGCL